MTTPTTVRELPQHIGKSVSLQGWVYNKRNSGKVKFLIFRDGSGTVQTVIMRDEVAPEIVEGFSKLTQESAVSIEGTVREDERAQGGVEIDVTKLTINHIAQEYPIGKKEHGPDFLLTNRHLWLRSSRPHAVLTIRDRFLKAIRDFYSDRGFLLLDTPIFTPAACEGTSTLFETDYFGEKAYLSQSGQLYGEAGAMAFGKVYCLGPTFRAEKSKTRRHLTEFWMVEPEVAYCDMDQAMELAEQFLEYTIQRVLKECQPELKTLERDTTTLERVKAPFPRVSYAESIKILHDKGIDFEDGNDFGAPDETAIGENFDKPVFIHRFPSKIKAFYMKHDPTDDSLAMGFDCIAPEGYGEIIGGAQREDDYDTLLKRLHEHNLDEKDFDWYLDLRKYGSVPHAGFGLGIERTVAWICGLEHLREAIPFPRLMHRLRP